MEVEVDLLEVAALQAYTGKGDGGKDKGGKQKSSKGKGGATLQHLRVEMEDLKTRLHQYDQELRQKLKVMENHMMIMS